MNDRYFWEVDDFEQEDYGSRREKPVPPEPPVKKRKFLRGFIIAFALLLAIGAGGVAGASLALHRMGFTPLTSDEATGTMLETAFTLPPGTLEAVFETADVLPGRRLLTLPELFRGANPAVVAISTQVTGMNVFGQRITRPSAGSGFFVSDDGYIVTNYHVIENASTITVLLFDGTELPATVVGRAPASDLAVIKVEGANFPFLTFGSSDDLLVGEQIAVIGNPLGELANSMTVGYVSAVNRDVTISGITYTKIQTDAAVNRGNSGGPMLNLYGEVVGVISAKTGGMDVEGLGFAIPSNLANQIVRQLIEHGDVRRAVLGVNVDANHQSGRIVLTGISPGSAAERAGLRAGDMIITFNGTEVTSMTILRSLLGAATPGDTALITVRRGNDTITVTVILDAATD